MLNLSKLEVDLLKRLETTSLAQENIHLIQMSLDIKVPLQKLILGHKEQL